MEGETQHRVLLLLDGYDEYTIETNEEIDEAIESTVGNCFFTLTSRSGGYVSKKVRDQTDGEITIEGFSKENVIKCSTLYLESEENSHAMLEQAKERDIDVLLHVPILLLMVCAFYGEKHILPKTKGAIFRTIFEMVMDRTALKTFKSESADLRQLNALLYTLFAWKALQSDTRQLLLIKVRLDFQ